MNVLSRKSILALSAVGAALALPPATSFANEADAVVTTVTVHIGDLDASTRSGALGIFSRLDKAARYVCGDDYAVTHRLADMATQHCEQQAVAPAVERVDSPLLTRIYLREFPGRDARVLIGSMKAG